MAEDNTDKLEEILNDDTDIEALSTEEEEGATAAESAEETGKTLAAGEHEAAESQEGQETVEERLARLEQLEKERRGQLAALKKEREKRQGIEAQYNKLAQTVSEILEKRARGTDTVEDEGKAKESSGIPVEFDDEGNPFVPPEHLEGMTKRQLKSIQDELAELKMAVRADNLQKNQAAGLQQFISSVVNEDPGFVAAQNHFARAWQWLDKTLAEKAAENDITEQPKTVGQVVDLCEAIGLDREFEKQFGVDVEVVLRALESRRNLRKALKAFSEDNGGNASQGQGSTDSQKAAQTLKKLAQKPGNLTGIRSAKGATLSKVDEVASKSFEDLLSMSDEEAAALQKALREEELRSI